MPHLAARIDKWLVYVLTLSPKGDETDESANCVLESYESWRRPTHLLQEQKHEERITRRVCLQIVGGWSTEYPVERQSIWAFHQEGPHGPRRHRRAGVGAVQALD